MSQTLRLENQAKPSGHAVCLTHSLLPASVATNEVDPNRTMSPNTAQIRRDREEHNAPLAPVGLGIRANPNCADRVTHKNGAHKRWPTVHHAPDEATVDQA
jgi:hypothetical protein